VKRIKVNECVRVGISVVLMVEGDDEANVRRKRGPGSVARYLEARRRSINARGMARMDGELAGAHCTALHCTALHCTALWSESTLRGPPRITRRTTKGQSSRWDSWVQCGERSIHANGCELKVGQG